MKSVIIISSDQLDLSRLSQVYGDVGKANLQSPQRLVVQGDWGWFAIEINAGLESEFCDSERSKIVQLLPEPFFSQLEYNNSSAADLAVRLMPATTKTLIDNDHGMLWPIEDVRQRIQAGVEWQTSST